MDPELVYDKDYKIYYCGPGMSPKFQGDAGIFHLTTVNNSNVDYKKLIQEEKEWLNDNNIDEIPIIYDCCSEFALGHTVGKDTKLFRNDGHDFVSKSDDVRFIDIEKNQLPILIAGYPRPSNNKVIVPLWDPVKYGTWHENMKDAVKLFTENFGDRTYFKTVLSRENEIGICVYPQELDLWKNYSKFKLQKTDKYYYVVKEPKFLSWKLKEVRNIMYDVSYYVDGSVKEKIMYSIKYQDYRRDVENKEYFVKDLALGNIVPLSKDDLMIKDIIE